MEAAMRGRWKLATTRRDPLWTVAIADPLGRPLLRLLILLRVSPNAVTTISILFGIGAAACFGLGKSWWGLGLYQASYVLDALDGKLAFILQRTSVIGHALDLIGDRIRFAAMFAAILLAPPALNTFPPALIAASLLFLIYAFNSQVLERALAGAGRPLLQQSTKDMPTSPWAIHRRAYGIVSLAEIEMAIIAIAPALALLGFPHISVGVLAGAALLLILGIGIKWKRFVLMSTVSEQETNGGEARVESN